MEIDFKPSVNLIRDKKREFTYLTTGNALRTADIICHDYVRGYRTFTLIGAYGTGKSSFMWAFQKSLEQQDSYFQLAPFKGKLFEVLPIVGEYASIVDYFNSLLVGEEPASSIKILEALEEYKGEADILLIQIDEFGKFLEYAVDNNPERELYFIQQLAEYVSDEEKGMLLLTSLHQNFEAYSFKLDSVYQRQEWKKINGRFKELTYNEPVEQLLYIASQYISKKIAPCSVDQKISGLIESHKIFQLDKRLVKEVEHLLYPLDLLSAIILAKLFQQFGQNERSLFSFFQSQDFLQMKGSFHLGNVYDYAIANLFNEINSTALNPKYRQWAALQDAVEKAEDFGAAEESITVIKVVGLLRLFARAGARIDSIFLKAYFKAAVAKKIPSSTLEALEKNKLILFSNHDGSYKIAVGTDLDFDSALIKAGQEVEVPKKIAGLLNEYFSFPIITAKEVSYEQGTPRLFEYVISDEPIREVPTGALDGYINIVFSTDAAISEFIADVEDVEEAVIYAFSINTKLVSKILHEILKVQKVIADNYEDKVAVKELEETLEKYKVHLSAEVLQNLYTSYFRWFFHGEEQNEIKSARDLNKVLSKVCRKVYNKSPRFNNELINKHRISSSIHTARKNLFEALVERWRQRDLGFSSERYPAEKTIYEILLKRTGIHALKEDQYELIPPTSDDFGQVWKAGEDFLSKSKDGAVQLSEFSHTLSTRPFKLKQGLIDFWIPIFLFIKRGTYALYREGAFVPFINKTVLYELTRNIGDYSLKAFSISGERLEVFNKYRQFAQLGPKENLSNETFIESIRPFLVFYKNIPDYTKATQRLSIEALQFREALSQAKDPEKTFFEDIPHALGYDLSSVTVADEEKLQEFVHKLNDVTDELKGAYQKLLDRIETHLILSTLAGDEEGIGYKKLKQILQTLAKAIAPHKLTSSQTIFTKRVLSEIEERDAWLASLCQGILGKRLDMISDKEEQQLYDRISFLVKELKNLVELKKDQAGLDGIRIEITTLAGGLKAKQFVGPTKERKDIAKAKSEIEKKINSLPGEAGVALLVELLEKRINEQ